MTSDRRRQRQALRQQWRDAMAELIQRLLRDTPAYRKKWRRDLKGATAADPPISAVARVVARQLRAEGEAAPDDKLFTRSKSLVTKLFRGEQLSRRTLDLIVAAFAIDESPDDIRRIEWMWKRRFVPSAQGELGPVWTALADVSPELIAARGCQRTVLLVEDHFVGPDRRPVRHRTRQMIEALVDGPDRHLYLHDAPQATVSIEKGGRLGRTLRLPASFVGVEIVYESRLHAGDVRTLVYETTFQYLEPPPPNFRRAALREVGSMSIGVTFDPEAVPDRVWWCVWEVLEQPPVQREEVPLGPELSVERFVPSAGGQIVGFEWQWG